MQETNGTIAQQILFDKLLTSLVNLSGVLKIIGENQQNDRIIAAADRIKATLNQLSQEDA